MIVTIIADVLGEANNGTTIAALHLIDALNKAGDTVRVVCPDKDKKNKVGYFIVPTIWVGPFQSIVDKNGVSLAKADENILRKAFDGTDLVHIMMPFSLGRKAAKLAKKLGIPCSAGFHVQAENVTAHFFNLMGNGPINHLVYKDFWAHFFKNVDAIHYPTEFIKDTFERNCGHKTNAYVISNGVSKDFHHFEVERPEELKGKFVILCTGRISKEKKQKLLIDAVALSKHKDEIQIIFAGSGPRLSELMARANKKGVEPIIKFFNHDELVNTINMADLYVHTSEIEIEAISCLEALSCGVVPVINDSPKSATKYFALDDKNLFKLNDPKDLANKIDYWFEHPEEKKERAKEYVSYCQQFDFDACMDRMVKMCHEVASMDKKPE